MRTSVIGAGISLFLLTASPAAAQTYQVKIVKGGGFRPASLTVKLGDSVRWTNNAGEKRQIVSNTGAFASPILESGKNWTFTFSAAGTYRYHDGLRPTLKGVVRVPGPPPSVTLSASLPVAIFGAQVTLSGVVSSKKEGQTWLPSWRSPIRNPRRSRSHRSRPQPAVPAASTTTPTIQTTYQARYRGSSSQPVTIGVRPKVTFSYAHRYMSTRISAASSFAGRFVYLHGRSRFGQWVVVRKLKLGPHSGRIFRPPNKRGKSTYWIFLTLNQAGPGYQASHSGTQRVRGR